MTAILVIEDSPSVLSTVLDILRVEGFDVFGAGNGHDGLRLAHEHLPDLIICDIAMPDLDGYGVLKALRSDSSTTTIPVIFLTARTTRTEMRHGMELGADDYITKPFAPLELLKAVKTQLDKQATIAHKFESTLSTLRANIAYALPHELKTPIIGIEGYGRLLMMDYDKIKPEQLREYATWIVKASERLQRVIENCLVYAQIELIAADPVQLEALRNHRLASPTDIIAEEARRSAESARRGEDLKLELGSNSPLQISEENFKKIVRELVNNAFKFSDSGKPVTVSASTEGEKFTFRIRDFGRGMTAEHIQSIGAYMQFERALYEQQGLGLGFVIAKRLVELHGGTTHVWSIPSQGTEVSVRFPAAKVNAEQKQAS